MSAADNLRQNLEQALKLPPVAVDWVLMLWGAIQVFDDVADGDPIHRQELDAAIWNTLVSMPQNPFFCQNASVLLPVVGTMILKWQASDQCERVGSVDPCSFVWRAGFYDVVLMVVQLCHGPKVAIDMSSLVMGLYGEKYEDYLKEFGHA